MNNASNEHNPQGYRSGNSRDCPTTGGASWGPDADWYASHAWCGIYPECCPGYGDYFGTLLCPWTRIVPSTQLARYKRAVLIDFESGTYGAPLGDHFTDCLAYAMQAPLQRMVSEPAEDSMPRHTHAVTVATCKNCGHAVSHDFVPLWADQRIPEWAVGKAAIQCVEPYCYCCNYEAGSYYGSHREE